MSMFGPKMGTWYVKSKTDPRWNNSGRGVGFVTSGGPIELKEWLNKCRSEYGEPPADGLYGFEKD